MRILTLSNCPLDPFLGSGKTRLRWTQGLRALGHEVDIFEPKDFEWWNGARRAIGFRQALGAIGLVGKRIQLKRYDLVEFFGGEFGIATRLLSREKKRPFIVAHTDGFELLASEREREYAPLPETIAGSLKGWYRKQTHDRNSLAAFRNADAFVTGCELDRRRVLEMGLFSKERTAVISPGLDGEYLAALAAAPKGRRIAYVGSWIARKGTAKIVEVMTHILAERPDVHLDLYGTGRGESVLGEFPASVRPRIAVYERLSNQQIADGLARAGVFFFPSQYEGFGMALAEAMACGCAPVTTPTGFGAELRNGVEALVCPFEDMPAMRQSILSMLDDDDLRARVGAAARERVRGLSWEIQIGKLAAAYELWLSADAVARERRASV